LRTAKIAEAQKSQRHNNRISCLRIDRWRNWRI
jgi:hypothetical protein